MNTSAPPDQHPMGNAHTWCNAVVEHMAASLSPNARSLTPADAGRPTRPGKSSGGPSNKEEVRETEHRWSARGKRVRRGGFGVAWIRRRSNAVHTRRDMAYRRAP